MLQPRGSGGQPAAVPRAGAGSSQAPSVVIQHPYPGKCTASAGTLREPTGACPGRHGHGPVEFILDGQLLGFSTVAPYTSSGTWAATRAAPTPWRPSPTTCRNLAMSEPVQFWWAGRKEPSYLPRNSVSSCLFRRPGEVISWPVRPRLGRFGNNRTPLFCLSWRRETWTCRRGRTTHAYQQAEFFGLSSISAAGWPSGRLPHARPILLPRRRTPPRGCMAAPGTAGVPPLLRPARRRGRTCPPRGAPTANLWCWSRTNPRGPTGGAATRLRLETAPSTRTCATADGASTPCPSSSRAHGIRARLRLRPTFARPGRLSGRRAHLSPNICARDYAGPTANRHSSDAHLLRRVARTAARPVLGGPAPSVPVLATP
jgi:hypothetical protein